jgi:hypothetical protein
MGHFTIKRELGDFYSHTKNKIILKNSSQTKHLIKIKTLYQHPGHYVTNILQL